MAHGMRIYYAHSMRIYGSDRECEEHQYLHRKGFRVCSPRGKLNRDNWYKRAQEFIGVLDAVVFTEYRDHIGRGVTEELLYAFNIDKPVYLLRDRLFYPVFNHNLYILGSDWAVCYAEIVGKLRAVDLSARYREGTSG